MRSGVLVMLILAAACGGAAEPADVGSGLVVERFDDFGAEHFAETDVQAIVDGTSSFAYDTFPATSGPHASSWAPCGIYTDEVPEVFSVHSMEHGAVVVHHDPALSAADLEAIRETARQLGSHVVVTPRSGLAEPVVLTAWTVLARLGEPDTAVIEEFWNTHAQQAPERLPCPMEIDEAG